MDQEYEEDLQRDDDDYEQEDQEVEDADLDDDEELESDPDSDPEHEQNAEGEAKQKPIAQDKVNEAIAKQHAKYREEQRKAQALQKELDDLRNRAGQQADPEPKIAEVDPYSDNVDEQIRKRDQSVRDHIAWQQRQRDQQYRQEQQSQQRQAEQQRTAQESEQRFLESAKKLRVNEKELQNAIQTVGQYQLGQEVAEYLMSDDKGVLMTTTLAKDPVLMSELSSMPLAQRLIHLERNVRSKINVSPRRSNGKRPPTRVKGRASDASDAYPLTGGRVKVE